MTKTLIIGLPRSGKTTKALEVLKFATSSTHIIHTDALVKDYEWSVFSDKVCDLLKQPGPWIIEGCSAVRGLRKYLKEGNVLDFEIVWRDQPYMPLMGRQIGFAASLRSIWAECQQLMENMKCPNK